MVSNFLFLTPSHILVIFFITISAKSKILTSSYVTWSGRLIVYLQPFQELVRILYFSPTAFLFMALVSGYSHPLPYKNIEVAFNKNLCRIGSLFPCSHSRIVHLVANLHNLFNVIYCRSKSLLFAAAQCPSLFVCTVFHDSSLYCFSFCGYNTMFGSGHIKQYYPDDIICAAVIRSSHRSVAGSNTEQII